jgi:maltodextrin utilization protein YvdJ
VYKFPLGFLHSDYNNKTDLHIALTTSQGTIVEFDRHGLRRHVTHDNKSLWEQSLVVETVSEAWYEHWDETLAKVLYYYYYYIHFDGFLMFIYFYTHTDLQTEHLE